MTAPKSSRPAKKARPTPSASEIAPGVFVGGWHEAVEFVGTRFCVLDELPPEMPAGTHLPIYDEATDRADRRNLDRLADAVGKARARGEPVLIFCGHGIRRSPLAAAWYLHTSEGITLDAAYARIKAVRPRIETVGEWVGHSDELDPR